MKEKSISDAARRNDRIRKMLEKQLKLLSERSHEEDCEAQELCALTEAMVSVAKITYNPLD